MRLGHPFYDRPGGPTYDHRGEVDPNVRWSRRLSKGRMAVEENAFGALEIYDINTPDVRIAITKSDWHDLAQCLEATSDNLEHTARSRGVKTDWPGVP